MPEQSGHHFTRVLTLILAGDTLLLCLCLCKTECFECGWGGCCFRRCRRVCVCMWVCVSYDRGLMRGQWAMLLLVRAELVWGSHSVEACPLVLTCYGNQTNVCGYIQQCNKERSSYCLSFVFWNILKSVCAIYNNTHIPTSLTQQHRLNQWHQFGAGLLVWLANGIQSGDANSAHYHLNVTKMAWKSKSYKDESVFIAFIMNKLFSATDN